MFRLMIQKLIHKKWMVLCLLIGNVLLIATAVSYPLYKNSSLKKMLDDEMTKAIEVDENADMLSFFVSSQMGGNTIAFNIFEREGDSYVEETGIDISLKTAHFNTVVSNVFSNLLRDDTKEQKVEMGMLRGSFEHMKLLSGRMPSDEKDEEGRLEAVVTTGGLVHMNLLIGEELEFRYVKDENGVPVKVVVVGVVDPVYDEGNPFVEDISVFDNELIFSDNAFTKYFLGDNFERFYLRCYWFYKVDLQSIEVENIEAVISGTENMLEEQSKYYKVTTPSYIQVLKGFLSTEKKIHVTLLILQVPVMALLLAFLLMISGQMIAMENNEISLLKSRGASKRQIGRLYLLQSLIMDVFSLLAGFPLGILMCQLIGSSQSFLQFNFEHLLNIRLNAEVFAYALGAAVCSVIITLVPALKASGLTIVKLKQKKARSDKKLWQKFYLDIIIFAVSLYGFYSFSRQTDQIIQDVLSGKGLDPLLYLSSVFFILGSGMLFLRIQPVIVKLIFRIGKKSWKPSGYASFLQIVRTGNKQHFVMLFLVLTVSLGIFDSAVARTIISNAETNITYMTGADIVLVENWPSNYKLVVLDPTIELKYTEPDFGKYQSDPHISKAARVYLNEEAYSTKGKVSVRSTVMAIDTKEYGEAVNFDSNILDKHINSYLNDISQNPDAVLCSRSYEKMQNYKLGDSITYFNNKGEEITGVIGGFFDYWPGYKPELTEVKNDGNAQATENYMIVSHLSTVQSEWGKTPYYVILKLKDNKKDDFFYDFVKRNNISLSKYTNLAESKEELRKDTLFQGTSGILTMSFIVVLILCLAGYLIYWVMSIRSRELLFGVLRAMGMRKKEIISMLINEQLATGVFAIVAGFGIGVAASYLFVPMIQLAYSGDNQVTPLSLTIQADDMIKLFGAILVMVIVCIVVLAKQISSMKITNALKLGED